MYLTVGNDIRNNFLQKAFIEKGIKIAVNKIRTKLEVTFASKISVFSVRCLRK